MKHLLSIGKFATLCKTTADTLIHYEKIGLLIPSQISDTNRRLYEPGQYHTFYIIYTLAKTGVPLPKIKQCLHADTQMPLTTLLRQKESELQQQLEHTRTIRHYFEESCAQNTSFFHQKPGHPFIQTQNDTRILYATLLGYHPLVSSDIIPTLITHTQECAHKNIYPFPLGLMLQKKSLYAQNNRQVLLYSPNPSGVVTNKTPVQLPGEYAVILHKGSFETINDSIELLYQFIEDLYAVVASHTYINFYHNSLPDTAESFYLIKIRFVRC